MWVENSVKHGLSYCDRDSLGQNQRPDTLNPSSVTSDKSMTLSKLGNLFVFLYFRILNKLKTVRRSALGVPSPQEHCEEKEQAFSNEYNKPKKYRSSCIFVFMMKLKPASVSGCNVFKEKH